MTPKVGLPTRLLIESLDRVPFTPSQGICTPSPTNMAAMLVHHHHHHHVYGNGAQQHGQQINEAYMAGLAAGRADALERGAQHTLIPAVYDSPGGVSAVYPAETAARSHRHGTKEQVHHTYECGTGGGDDDDDDAKSIGGDVKDGGSKRCKVGNTVDLEDARQVALAICSGEGVQLMEGQEIPDELVALGSLIITLQIPVQLAMCPANQFSSPKKGGGRCPPLMNKKLNARQRRTLRRAQERAWKELEALQKDLPSPAYAPVHQVYSPTCMTYGVNPAAFAEYNYMMMHHPSGMGVPPSPTHIAGFGYQHVPVMAPPPGVAQPHRHHHQHNPRGLSRFAKNQEHD